MLWMKLAAWPLPSIADIDGDGLNDGQEKAAGTDPTKADTDGDLFSDGAEVASGSNPLSGTSAAPIGRFHQLLAIAIVFAINGHVLVWMYSIPILALSLSTYISLNFSRTHNELETQLELIAQLGLENYLAQQMAGGEAAK